MQVIIEPASAFSGYKRIFSLMAEEANKFEIKALGEMYEKIEPDVVAA
jgi:hypothetical protein